ncbi:MAG: hypothetical protein ACLFU8_05815 [Anaerolineales bacterium]
MVGRSKLVERIRAVLEHDPRTGDATVNGVDDDGLITLEDEVGDQEIREALEQIDRSFVEVGEVVTDLATHLTNRQKLYA